MDPKTLDTRLQRLALRDRRITPEEIEQQAEKLPDLSENVASPSEEELEALRAALPVEQAVREERIRAAVERYHDETSLVPPPEPDVDLEPGPETDPET
jgi:hypothetical protein